MTARLRFPWLSTFAFLVFAIAVVVWWPAPKDANSSPSPRSPDAERSETDDTSASPAAQSAAPSSNEEISLQSAAAMMLRIEQAHAQLLALAASNASLAERAALLQSLRIELRAPGQRASADAIALFLESGRDAPTGFVFTPEPGGFLQHAPTLRTLLLDELERIDLTRAREVAEIVFTASAPVAEEWSLALRIAAHADRRADGTPSATFVQRVQTLLENPAWQETPTAGYLHGFDAAVHSGDLTHVDTLAHLSGSTAPEAVRFATRLALDRMVMNDFAGVISALLRQPSRSVDDARFRGTLFARADVSDPRARAVLEEFLTSASTSAAELQTWTDYFPHRSKHVSDNLLTSDRPTPIAELARMDRAALDVVRGWRADPALSARRAELAVVEERLERFVASADRGDAARETASTD